MAQTAEPALPEVVELTAAESWALFDRHARELLGISGEEFVRRWRAGEYDEIADDGEHSDIMWLAMFPYCADEE